MSDVKDAINVSEEPYLDIDKNRGEIIAKYTNILSDNRDTVLDYLRNYLNILNEKVINEFINGSLVHSLIGILLVDKDGAEIVLDLEKHKELLEKIVSFGPYNVHGYVLNDNKFHIWLEKVEVLDEQNRDFET